MSVTFILFSLAIIAFLALVFFKKKLSSRAKMVLTGIFLIGGFGQMILPRQLYGLWNALSAIKNKTVRQIVLKPSQPGWDVNLTDAVFVIDGRATIDSIVTLLKSCEVHIPTHPDRKWETYMTFFTTDGDSVKIRVQQSSNNGTILYQARNDLRKDELQPLLERLTKFRVPQRGVGG